MSDGPGVALDPAFVADELRWIIEDAIEQHPRSQQAALGPSEIGDPCARRLGYKLLAVESTNHQVAWKQTVGTAVHTWLENALRRFNATWADRWLVEETLYVGNFAGRPLFGHGDVYDRASFGVWDWKLPGTYPLRNYKANGPGEQYRQQGHLYGRGWQLRGMRVDYVGIAFLPRADDWEKAVFWHEPYDEQIALDALARAEGINTTTQTLGAAALDVLPPADAYCHRCPWFKPRSESLTEGCPGAPSRAVRAAAPQSELSFVQQGKTQP